MTHSLETRKEALIKAAECVEDVVERHPLEGYSIVTLDQGWSEPTPGSIKTWMTPAEQFVSLTIQIADWLLDFEEPVMKPNTFPSDEPVTKIIPGEPFLTIEEPETVMARIKRMVKTQRKEHRGG